MLATKLTFLGLGMCVRASMAEGKEKEAGMTDITKEKEQQKETKSGLKRKKRAEKQRKNKLAKERKQLSKEEKKGSKLYEIEAKENDKLYRKDLQRRKHQTCDIWSPPEPNVPVFAKCPPQKINKKEIHRSFKQLTRKIDAMAAWDDAALKHAMAGKKSHFATPLFRNSEGAATFIHGRAIYGHEAKPIENKHGGVVVGCDRVAASLDRHFAPVGFLKTTSSTPHDHISKDEHASLQYGLKVQQVSSPALQYV